VNLEGFGDGYLELVKERYCDRQVNEFPLKERINYIQVQANELSEMLLRHQKVLSTKESVENIIKAELLS
jgi:hypothetical protein